ncbi:MAG: hypothetical protein HY752_04455 [Nitrospirae bacterium]|nr:hypothetical protein [Nitrospirota bacterium]
MLTSGELKHLSTASGNGNFFVSLYLNVNSLTNPKGEYVIHFKNMLKKTTEKLNKDVMKKVKEDIEKIEASLIGNKRGFKKGLAVISSIPLGFWREYHFSLPVRNELIIDDTPYVKPLFTLLNNYPRYVVLLIDKESARIFLIHLGKIELYTEHITPDIPGRHKKGGWFALEQSRYERHIDYHISLHMKDVIKSLEELLHKESVDKIIIGGSEDAIVKIKNMLSRTILDKVISIFHPEKLSGDKDILDETLEIIRVFEREKEREIVKELITRTMKNNMAVIGLEDVLNSIQEGRVMTLIFLKDMAASGLRCIGCGFLTSQTIKTCPYCGGNFEKASYLIDLSVQKAVEQGAAIEVITDSEGLLNAGGIGAFLRF